MFTLVCCLMALPISAKTLHASLLAIYQENRHTFLCEQPFNKLGKATVKLCSRCPKSEAAIVFMPIVPLQKLASELRCYNDHICINKNGNTFKGLRCCFEQDPFYKAASLDLHNFVPELTMIKQQRRSYTFSALNEAPSPSCQLHIDKKKRLIHAPTQLRGMIARTTLYMRDKYHFKLSEEETSRYQSWHRQYPPTQWEKERNEKIGALQGNKNHYVR